MLNKAITISVGILSLTTSAALATGLTERMQSQRMTVVRVDPIKGQFLCASKRWDQAGQGGCVGDQRGRHHQPRPWRR